ncbi:UNVERIFIED_CONTAM: hypothetical protein K2H54_063841 [Gekko kuhli]
MRKNILSKRWIPHCKGIHLLFKEEICNPKGSCLNTGPLVSTGLLMGTKLIDKISGCWYRSILSCASYLMEQPAHRDQEGFHNFIFSKTVKRKVQNGNTLYETTLLMRTEL